MNKAIPFIVQPLGGLANRMRVVSVCRDIAREAGVRMQVCWATDGGMGARWEQLFLPVDFDVIAEGAPREIYYCSRRWYRRFPVLKYQLQNGFDRFLPAPDADDLLDQDEPHPETFCRLLVSWLRKGKRVYLSTGSYLGLPRDLSMFRPLPEIDSAAHHYANEHQFAEGHTYGLHIRRTDNTWAIEQSPLTLFEEQINSIISKDNTALFYLASDDKTTIEQLRQTFGERILVREKTFGRSSVTGIQDALTDMLLLSRTQHIFGSFFSSFSEMASWMGSVPLTILKSAK